MTTEKISVQIEAKGFSKFENATRGAEKSSRKLERQMQQLIDINKQMNMSMLKVVNNTKKVQR